MTSLERCLVGFCQILVCQLLQTQHVGGGAEDLNKVGLALGKIISQPAPIYD